MSKRKHDGEEDTELSGHNQEQPESLDQGQANSLDAPGDDTKEYVVLTDKATIDDGKGGAFKVCNSGDKVHLSDERARQLKAGGVILQLTE